MAGDNTRETESRGEGSQTQEEKRQTRSESTERERSSQQQQQQNNNATNHQIPLYPLPPPLAARPSMLPPLSHGLGYNPFNSDPFRSERPYDPKWHRAKLILLGSSLVSSAIIIGVCLAMGLMNSQHYVTDLWYQPIDYVFATSATAAGLAICITTLELFITARSSRRQGMRPGLLIALHLFIWLMCIPANFVAGVYAVHPERPTWRYYDVYHQDRESTRQLDNLFAKTSACLRTVFAFDLILIVLHFVLFVRACVETHRINRARRNRRRQTVLVPVMQAPPPPAAAAGFPAAAVPRMGAYPPYPYPHPHQPLPPNYPYYPAPPPAAAAPVSAPYPPPKGAAPAPAPATPPAAAAAVPPAASRSPVPTPTPTPPPPPAAVYGGYYGPVPAPASVPTQQQQSYPNYAAYAGYYAPMQLPTQPMMVGGYRRHSSSSSSSRNNRRSSQRRSSRTAAESAEPQSTEKPSS